MPALLCEVKIKKLEEWQKHVVLLVDEMHIKDELVYGKYTGDLVGFINLGELNYRLLRFENECSATSSVDSTEHVRKLYYHDRGENHVAPGLFITKLKLEHIKLTKRVDLAAQVLRTSCTCSEPSFILCTLYVLGLK